MKVLVLGVTGHIGSAVTRELLARGHAVTGVARQPRARANLAGLPVSYVRGDLDHQANLDSWVSGHDAVVDAAAPYPVALPRATSSAALVRDATTRTRRLLSAARRHRAPVAYVSSFGTLPQRRVGLDRWATNLIQRLHPYFAIKSAIENAMIEAACDGQPLVIVNPTGCLGPWDLKPRERCFVPALLRGEMPAATDQMLNVIDVRDVAIGLVNALEGEVYGAPIALVGHNISNENLFRWICEIGGVKPPPFTATSSAAVITTYLSEVTLGAIGVEPPLPALIAMLTYIHGYLPPSIAQVDLGLVPRPLSRTLLETIEWYRAIGYC